tara:strand:+ start:34 stop:2391 length:2358 start_codon:yes stop_codon:yes gene_type:complete
MANKSVGLLTIAFGADLRGFDRAMKKAQRNIKKFGTSMQRTGKNLTRNITLPIIGLGAVAVKTFMSFEQSMLKVKAVSGATAVEFKALTDNAKKLGASTMFTASEVAGLQFELAKLGFSTNEINESTESILRLSQATTHDLAESGEIVASTLKSFNLEAAQSTKVADIFALASSNAAMDMQKLSVAMPTVGATANAVGVPLEELTAQMMVLADRGIEASTMGTHLRKVFVELATKGISFDAAMQQINNSTNKVKTATELFGKRAFATGLILAENTHQTSEYENQLRKSAGTSRKMAEIMDSGTGGALRRLKSAMEGVAIDLGKMLIPLFQKLMNIVQKGINFWKGLDKNIKSTVVTLGLIAASIGPILTIVGSLTSVFALLLTPVGAVVAALVVGGILIVKNWSKIKQPLVDTINYFIELYNESMLFRASINLIIAAFKNMWASAKFAFNLIIKLGSSIIKNLVDQVKGFGTAFKGALSGDLGEIKAGLKQYGKAVKNQFIDIAKITKEEGKILADEVAKNYQEALVNTLEREKIEFITTDDVDNTVKKAKDLANKVMEQFKKLFGTDINIGTTQKKEKTTPTTPLDQFKNSPFGRFLAIMKSHQDAFKKLNEEIKKTKSLMDILKDTFGMEGLIEATKTFENVFSSAMTSAAYSQEGFFKSFLQNLKQAIKQMLIQLAITTAIKFMFGGGKVSPKQAFGLGLKDVLNLSKVPFAQGGLVTGPVSALIGEGAGTSASNPEVVAPLDKLKGMIGGGTQQVEVYGRISGNDIFISNQRGGINRLRSV